MFAGDPLCVSFIPPLDVPSGPDESSMPSSCGTAFHSVSSSFNSMMSLSSVEISFDIKTNSA
jgi:hypothetical protein